jgi:thioredoxin-related protein
MKKFSKHEFNAKRTGIAAASRRVPLVLMISSTDCPYCDRLKTEVFWPLLKHKPDAEKIVLFELLIDVDADVWDFAGNLTTASAFAKRYKATVTPTVLFLGPDGTELAERMIGVPNYDFYPWYFDQRVELATERLRHVINN